MRIVFFCHSLLSDWNHGNAHFLRGVLTELIQRGHDVRAFEPRGAWSMENLLADHGPAILDGFHATYPLLRSETYDLATLDLDRALERADVVVVHEWSEPALVQRVGEHRKRTRDYVLLFHDTHHRMVTQPSEMSRYELSHYDGVLAFGEVLRALYLERAIEIERRFHVRHDGHAGHQRRRLGQRIRPAIAERVGFAPAMRRLINRHLMSQADQFARQPAQEMRIPVIPAG